MALDPDDPRPPYQQVAAELRAAILSKRLQPGERLPSGAALAKEYGVARMTVQQAIRLLRDDSLVVSRQGSGVFVRMRGEQPTGLGQHLEQAFAAERVSIDYAGFTGESLDEALAGPLEKVRTGRLSPRSVHVRLLLPDASRPWGLPCRADDLRDDRAYRGEAGETAVRAVSSVRSAVEELSVSGLVPAAEVEVRVHPLTPSFTLYVLNGRATLFEFSPVLREPAARGDHDVLTLPRRERSLVHLAAGDPDSVPSRQVDQARDWFDSVWTTVARPPA